MKTAGAMVGVEDESAAFVIALCDCNAKSTEAGDARELPGPAQPSGRSAE